MTAPALLYQDACEYCTGVVPEPADRECGTCNAKRWGGYMRETLERMKTVAPGLTNAEVELLESFIAKVEAS